MRYDFKSGFAEMLRKFVEQKCTMGFSYDSNKWILNCFDEMCYARYPSANELTKNICNDWAVKKSTESGTSFRNRISPVREFAKFLIRNGEQAYVIPTDLAKKSARHLPYIYSKDEVVAIWEEFDKLSPISYLPTRHLVLPAIIRVLYCCGLRPIEACRLTPDDADLSCGKLFIRESKGHKDRIVMMADDVADYMRGYDNKVSKILPNRKWFFPGAYSDICNNRWLNTVFRDVRKKLDLCGINGSLPRLYDFRHTMATHRLYEWIHDGKDLNVMLPYLSAYMGHAQLSDTYYYIHLVPEQFQAMTGIDFSRFEELLPEVAYDD